ncbi:MAG: extracellular solute-binding protein [Anaerolineae bacterium]|nr:extracellular solute-binding protein [Anaerolineae bacterium]
MTKKYFIVILVVLTILSITSACGAATTSETTTGADTPAVEQAATPVPTEETPIAATEAMTQEALAAATETATEEAAATEAAAAATGEGLQLWSTETQPDRAEKTRAMLARFTEQSGINVELILIEEDALAEVTTSAQAAGTLPDVIVHPLEYAIGWTEQGILNPDAASAVVEKLGPETFAEGPLNLVKVDDKYVSVPSDGWGQLIIYRADWFEEKGLEPPTTYETLEAAAQALTDPDNNIYGITAATKAGEVFTQQTFEQFALANNCQLVNDAGEITLNSPECVEAVGFFTNLLRNYGPPGDQDVDTTRANYFAGQAGMLVWSPFILDEMAGLRDDAFPACPECKDDPAYLSKNSGIAPTLAGPRGAPAQFGSVSYTGITTNADFEAAQALLEFWYNDGYLDWLSLSPEGKFPMRQGAADNPTQFVDGWKTLETGVDRKAALGDIYGDEIINTLAGGVSNFTRWGFPQGQGALVTAVYQALPVPQYLRETIDEQYTPEEAVEEMQFAVEDLVESAAQ